MPPATLADDAVTDICDQAGALATRASSPVTPGHAARKARALLPSPAGRLARTDLPAAARPDSTGDTRTESRGDRLRRVAGLLRRVLEIGGSYHDPLFERSDLIEDDYYRFRNQPRG